MPGAPIPPNEWQHVPQGCGGGGLVPATVAAAQQIYSTNVTASSSTNVPQFPAWQPSQAPAPGVGTSVSWLDRELDRVRSRA